MAYIKDRGSTHVYKVSRLSKEEMDSMISRCVYEQPAYCVAACPLKLDSKALLQAVAEGRLKKAMQIYERIAPFPIILASGCSAPCESRCRLGEIGDGLAIRDIELALAAQAGSSRGRGVFRMKKKKTAAVLGAGLFCLLLAGELEKKAYPLTVFCAEADLESYLRAGAGFLPEALFQAELQRLGAMDIEFEFSQSIDRGFIERTRASFDLLCLEYGLAEEFFPGRDYSEELCLFEEEGIVSAPAGEVLPCALAAKRGALTVDRLAQNVDPRSMRGEEGSADSRLFTSLEGVEKLRRVEKTGEIYSPEQAREEAGRCIQCSCQECMKGCAYLRHYKKHPGLLAREIYNNTQIIMGDHQMNKPMNSCALCGQCAVTCPSGFDMERVCRLARENMVSTDKMPLAPHEFALMDMMFSNGEAFLCRKQPGFERCRYVFFPGCQAAAIAPETVRAAYADLCERLPGGVALMLGCCGAISDWAGRYELYGQTRKFIDEELAGLSDPVIIAGCPSCRKTLSRDRAAEVVGIWELLEKLGLPQSAVRAERPFALHDSCGARGDSATQAAIRGIAKSLGCELLETEYSGDSSPCCGYGGLTAYANPPLAREMTEKCLERSDAPYISYCMACRDRFAREGRESVHILELVYGKMAGPPPDISEKRYNRLKLREELLRDIWGEETEKVERDLELEFSPQALKLMDERMILKSDIISVMEYIRESGEAIEDRDTGLYIGRRRVGNVSFWVKFTREGDSRYIVHSAYSHRMQIERRL